MGPFDDVTFAILAGGRSTRMGGFPKGLILVDGVTILERLTRVGAVFAKTLLVASDPSPYAAFGLETCPDLIPDRGAPGGLHAALSRAETPWVLAVACDMPYVTFDALQPLLAARTADARAVLYRISERLEPLLGLYHSSLATPFGTRLGRSGASFSELLEHVPATLLSEADLRAVDPALQSLRNLNAPTDLPRA